jgi:hypothetical protein
MQHLHQHRQNQPYQNEIDRIVPGEGREMSSPFLGNSFNPLYSPPGMTRHHVRNASYETAAVFNATSIAQQQLRRHPQLQTIGSISSFGSSYYSPAARSPSPPYNVNRNRNVVPHHVRMASLSNMALSTGDDSDALPQAGLQPRPFRQVAPRPSRHGRQTTYIFGGRSRAKLNSGDPDFKVDSTDGAANHHSFTDTATAVGDEKQVHQEEDADDNPQNQDPCTMSGILGCLGSVWRFFRQPLYHRDPIGLVVWEEFEGRLDLASQEDLPWSDKDWLLCPIQQTIMTDPVMDSDDHSFQRD